MRTAHICPFFFAVLGMVKCGVLVWNLLDATSKAKLCANGCCNLKANQKVIMSVSWYFGVSSMDNSKFVIVDEKGVFYSYPDNKTYYACTPNEEMVASNSPCSAAPKNGQYDTFDLVTLTAYGGGANVNQLEGKVELKSGTKNKYENKVIVKKS